MADILDDWLNRDYEGSTPEERELERLRIQAEYEAQPPQQEEEPSPATADTSIQEQPTESTATAEQQPAEAQQQAPTGTQLQSVDGSPISPELMAQYGDQGDKYEVRNGYIFEKPEYTKSKRSGGLEPGQTMYGDNPLAMSTEALGVGAGKNVLGMLNAIPGVTIPVDDLKYKDPNIEGATNFFGDLLVGIYTGKFLIGAGTKFANSKYLPPKVREILQGAFVRRSGTAMASVGGFTLPTLGNPDSATDENIPGLAKKYLPKWMGDYIPSAIATMDTDLPDERRAKNVGQSLGLGWATDALPLVLRFAFNKSRGGLSNNLIPENELAEAWLKKNKTDEISNIDEAIEKGFIKNQEALDDVGRVNQQIKTDTGVDLDKPTLGVHDVFDEGESAVRTLDNYGVVGASIDQARIANNLGTTNGRLRSVIREGGMKFVTQNGEYFLEGMQILRKELQEAGEYSYKLDDGILTNAEIRSAGEQLAAQAMDMDIDQLRAFVQSMQSIDPSTRIPQLTDVGASTVMNLIKNFNEEFTSLPAMTSRAYANTSVAGNAADVAFASRLTEDPSVIARSQERALDMLKYLMVQRGFDSYVKGRALNQLNIWNRVQNKLTPAKLAAEQLKEENSASSLLKTINKVIKDSDDVIGTLDYLRKQNPEYLKPFMFALEYTDGNVKSIEDLIKYWNKSFSLKKALVDFDPQVASLPVKGWWANIYNNLLAGVATPLKAMQETHLGTLAKGFTVIAGAPFTGNKDALRAGLYLVNQSFDMQKASLKFATDFWKKSTDPNVTSVLGRRDAFIRKSEQQWEILEAIAEAEELKGNFGPRALFENTRNIWEVADDNFGRFGGRGLLSADAMASMYGAQYEAGIKAFSAALESEEKIDSKALAKVKDTFLKEMFDEEGYVKSEYAIVAAKEIALNMDSRVTDALNGVMTTFPILKPFLMFPKTNISKAKVVLGSSPLREIPFVRMVGDFQLPFEKLPKGRAEEILTKYGISMENPAEARLLYEVKRAEIKGRRAITGMLMGGASAAYLQGDLTGDNTSDAAIRRFRDSDAKVPRRSFKTPIGWVSYEGFPFGLSEWLATTVNFMDEAVYGNLEERDFGDAMASLSLLLSSVFDKDTMKLAEPLAAALQGDFSELQKFSANFIPSMESQNSNIWLQFQRTLDTNLNKINGDTLAAMRERTLGRGLNIDDVSFLTGKPVQIYDNPLLAALAKNTPYKIEKGVNPNMQFLLDVQFIPNFTESIGGVKLSIPEQIELKKRIGERGVFNETVTRLRKKYNSKAYRKEVKGIRDQPFEFDLSKNFLQIELQNAWDREKGFAETQLSTYQRIQDRLFEDRLGNQRNKVPSSSVFNLQNK